MAQSCAAVQHQGQLWTRLFEELEKVNQSLTVFLKEVKYPYKRQIMFYSLSSQTETLRLSGKSIFSVQYAVWYPSHRVLLNPLITYWQGSECNSTLKEASQIKSHQSDLGCVTADHSWKASPSQNPDAWAGSVMFLRRSALPHYAFILAKNCIISVRWENKTPLDRTPQQRNSTVTLSSH